MTFRPYAWKIRLGNTENFLDIDDLTDGYLLWRNGSKVTSTLIDQGKLSLSAPQNPNDAATKQYVDDNLTADESARVAADIHLQAQIDALMGTSLTSGDKGDITIAADGYAWNIDAGAVTNAKLAAVGSGIIKGRASAGTGAVEDLTGTQATALLDVFSTEAKGLVPAAASGGTTNFLRADGVWAAPPAGTVTDVSVVSANGLAGTVANSGTTPAITLSTSVSGVLKGNGTAISAAISGTDYAPATSGTSILAGDGSGGFSNVTVGSGLALENGTLAATASSSSVISVTEGSAPAATAGVGKLWANGAADARPYWIDDTGQVLNLTFDRFNTLAPGASVAIDLSPALPVFNSLSLNGNTAFTTTNLGPGRSVSVRVVCDGTDRNLTFPETWRWLGSGPPSALPANGIGYLSITAFGNTDGDVLAGWSYETVGDSFGLTDGDKGDITVASSGAVWTIDSGSVTNDKLANVATATFKGRATAGTGAVEDMTGTQATALLDVFTTTAKGLVPVAAGGGTTNFLRADGYWAAPPAGTVIGVSVVSANGLAGTVANSDTAPAITLSTSVTGLLKGNGTAISAAAAGTDYAPATSGSSILAGNGSGGFSSVSVGSGLALADGVLSATPSSSSVVSVTEGSAPSATAGTGKLWASSAADARPYWLDDTGQSFNLTLDRFNTLTPAASVVIDTSPALPIFNSLALNQNTTFTTSNLGSGRSASVRIICDGTDRQLTFPGTWKWLGSGPPSGLLANNVGYLSVVAFGSTDTDVVAAWSYENMAEPGTVTSVSVAAANGLAGTVANSGTTPAITLSTSVTGVLKGDGTAISAAVSGTDYAPATSGTAILKGNGAGGFSSAAAGTDYAPATSGTSILYGNNSGGFSNVTVGTGLTFSAGTLSSNLVGVTDGDKGDITVASTGTSWTIDSGAVTNAKLANVATATIKGRTTAGTGAVEDLTGTQATALLDTFTTAAKGLVPAATGGGTTNFLRADGTWAAPPAGTVTSVSVVSANGLAGTVANATTTPAITLSTSVTGLLQGNGTAISAATIGTGLSFTGGTLSNTQVGLTDGDKGDITVASSGASWTIDSGAVTNAKLANVATATIKGRATAGTGAVEDLTGTQATALLDTFTTTAKGLVPAAASGGTTNFLRADGYWAAPPAGTVTDISVVSANGLAGTVANSGTTPAITLSTSVTGLLKGNGTAISAAVSGTDYAPATSGTSLLYGNGSGGFSNATVGASLAFTSGTLSRAALTGDVTATANSNATTIANNAVTNAKLADIATSRIKGRVTAGTGDPEDLTGTQVTTLLDTFTSTLKGLAPASGGGTSNFLRADGTWAAPPNSGGTVTSVSVVSANGLAGTVANATTTPAITLSTSVSGLLKGNGTAISAAVSGVDYAPAGNYVTTDTTQTITAAKAIDIADDVAPALRITQRGAGEALRVEDSTNIDSSPFVIDKNGNVGVGTAAPGAKLHVSSGSDGWAKWEASATSSSYMSFVKGGTSTEVGYIGTDGGGILAGGTGDNFGIRSENDLLLMAGSAERARITGDGRVGIATTSPGAMLDINTSGATSVTLYSAEFQSSSGTTNAGRVLFSQGSTYAMAIAPAGTSATTGRIDFQYITRSTGAVATTPLSIRGDGNVGIGATSPSKRLHISGSGLLIDGASSVESAPLAARLIVDSGASTGHTLADLRNDNGSTLFVGGTNVGIGTSSPSASNRLTVSASTNNSLASIAISNTYISTGTWQIAVPGTGKALDFAYNGSTRGYLSNSVNQGIIDFTGQHRSAFTNIGQLENGGVGLIVVAAGDYQSLSGANKIDINEALPRVTLSSTRNQKSVFGVISDREDDNSSTREYWVGNFVNVYDKSPGDNRLVINSLGEGAIWICNINGNLENGDFITSCEVPGYGMRQDDDLMHNYTVAKITCDCDFDLSSTDYICQEFEFNGTVYRKAFVGCTYHCG